MCGESKRSTRTVVKQDHIKPYEKFKTQFNLNWEDI